VSFGYPACPNLADQRKLFALLRRGDRRAADRGGHDDPEASVSALVLHHAQAEYFSVGPEARSPGIPSDGRPQDREVFPVPVPIRARARSRIRSSRQGSAFCSASSGRSVRMNRFLRPSRPRDRRPARDLQERIDPLRRLDQPVEIAHRPQGHLEDEHILPVRSHRGILVPAGGKCRDSYTPARRSSRSLRRPRSRLRGACGT